MDNISNFCDDNKPKKKKDTKGNEKSRKIELKVWSDLGRHSGPLKPSYIIAAFS